MSLTTTLKKGRELREALLQKEGADSGPERLPDPSTNLSQYLTSVATEQLKQWNENAAKQGVRFDYEAERLKLIAEFGKTCKTVTAEEYSARNDGVALALVNKESDENYAPLPNTREELIIDTVARWIWLQKRSDSRLKMMSTHDARECAIAAVKAEMSRVRRMKNAKRQHGKGQAKKETD